MKEKIREGKWNRYYDLRGGRILGDEDFEQEVHKMAGEKRGASMKLKMDVKAIWVGILKREGLNKEPDGWKRSRLIGETAYLAVEGAGIRQKAVADHFNAEPTAVNKAVKRLEGRWEKGIDSREGLWRWAKGMMEPPRT